MIANWVGAWQSEVRCRPSARSTCIPAAIRIDRLHCASVLNRGFRGRQTPKYASADESSETPWRSIAIISCRASRISRCRTGGFSNTAARPRSRAGDGVGSGLNLPFYGREAASMIGGLDGFCSVIETTAAVLVVLTGGTRLPDWFEADDLRALTFGCRTFPHAAHDPQRRDCLAGHVRFELRNVVANYPFESSRGFPGSEPNSGHGDHSRLSCSAGDTQLGAGFCRDLQQALRTAVLPGI